MAISLVLVALSTHYILVYLNYLAICQDSRIRMMTGHVRCFGRNLLHSNKDGVCAFVCLDKVTC